MAFAARANASPGNRAGGQCPWAGYFQVELDAVRRMSAVGGARRVRTTFVAALVRDNVALVQLGWAPMLARVKNFLTTTEPFASAHMGPWIRTLTFRRYFEHEVPGAQIRRVLDAGCGDGFYSSEIARKLPNATVVGVDIHSSPRWSDYPLSNLEFQQGDLRDLRETDSYDLIVSIDSLEHITDNREVMRSFWASLRPGGILYLAMPRDNDGHYILPERWFHAHKEWEEHEHTGEQYNLEELKAILEGIGFSIRLSRYTFTIWGRLSWELEGLLQGGRMAFWTRPFAMPLFKGLGLLDLHFPLGSGHNLIIAQKDS